jgi:hypothetical protein
MHPKPHACSLVSSQLGADRDRGRGRVDQIVCAALLALIGGIVSYLTPDYI